MNEIKLPSNWTLQKLRDLSRQDRFKLWQNAKHSKLPEALALMEAIESTGPYYDTSGITNDEIISLEMGDIINSKSGRAACFAATEAGLPALAGVEPMIVTALGDRYRQTYMATVQAGSLVGKMMQLAGYKQLKQIPMPEGSVAKTATAWRRNK